MNTRSSKRKEARGKPRASVVERSQIAKGKYRYVLTRTLDRGKGTLVVILCNPSYANACQDDHTITKLTVFASMWGYRHLVILNLLAYRTPYVNELWTIKDPLGDNLIYLRANIGDGNRVVVAWGNLDKIPLKWHSLAGDVHRLARYARRPLYCFGLTKNGHPMHPLRLSYKTKLRRWA